MRSDGVTVDALVEGDSNKTLIKIAIILAIKLEIIVLGFCVYYFYIRGWFGSLRRYFAGCFRRWRPQQQQQHPNQLLLNSYPPTPVLPQSNNNNNSRYLSQHVQYQQSQRQQQQINLPPPTKVFFLVFY